MNYFSVVMASISITATSLLSIGAYQGAEQYRENICDEIAVALEEARLEGVLSQEEADLILDRCIASQDND